MKQSHISAVTGVFAALLCLSSAALAENQDQEVQPKVDMRTPMAKAFDECTDQILSAEERDQFNECRRTPKSKWSKLNNRKHCMSLVPKSKVKPLMDCVTENSAR